jgi:hypothetical protein
MDRRMIAAFLLLGFADPAVAATPVYKMTLTIDDEDLAEVSTGVQANKYLAKCKPPKTCSNIYIHREPQIDFGANWEDGGYTVGHRTGPPGPEFEAQRKGKGDKTHFTLKELEVIVGNYLAGKQTPFVRWNAEPLGQ